MSLGMEIGLGPGDFVLDGDPAPSPKRGRSPSPQFAVHFYCGQTAGCIKMSFGMDVGSGIPTATQFWPMSIVAKWLDG